MAEKIFISYNHNDDVLIDTITRRLELEFGRDNIFYDAWSMQPGDSIIGKMNQGLGEFTTFFFFVSKNSLNSKMVSLEWQTALNRSINNDLKFVAVRIDDCSVPVILSDRIYIDLYGKGMDSAVSEMKCVIKSENTYQPLKDVENIKAKFEAFDNNTKVKVTVKALLYAENNPTFAFVCGNDLKEFTAHFSKYEGMVITNYGTMVVEDGVELNMRTAQLQRPLRPGFPFIFDIELVNTSHLNNVAVYILINAETQQYKQLPVEE